MGNGNVVPNSIRYLFLLFCFNMKAASRIDACLLCNGNTRDLDGHNVYETRKDKRH